MTSFDPIPPQYVTEIDGLEIQFIKPDKQCRIHQTNVSTISSYGSLVRFTYDRANTKV